MFTAAILTRSAELRNQVCRLLASSGYRVAGDSLWHHPTSPEFGSLDLAIMEWSGEGQDAGVELARELRRANGSVRLVVLALKSSEALAIEAVRLRAEDYLKAPFGLEELAAVVARCRQGGTAPSGRALEDAIVGESAAMRGVRDYIARIARTDSSVLITGETGTGKEKVAESIHEASRRRNKPFVCVNCAAIPDTLLESELFGHERGAFTGASAARDGKLKQANGGTLFFDEIGDMSLAAQAKILRAIEAREICPLGSSRGIHLDVRVIAATNRDLDSLMREERFRADLYFRLNVGHIHLPPLRERIADIPLLVQHFLPQFNRTFGRRIEGIRETALRDLMSYSWPGNVRELRNVMEIMFVHLPPRPVTLADLHEEIASKLRGAGGMGGDERERMVSALLATHWNISEAARKLHWSRMTLYRKLAKYDVARDRDVTEKPRKATA